MKIVKKELKKLALAASRNHMRSFAAIACVRAPEGGLFWVATDGHRIHFQPAPDGPEGLVIPSQVWDWIDEDTFSASKAAEKVTVTWGDLTVTAPLRTMPPPLSLFRAEWNPDNLERGVPAPSAAEVKAAPLAPRCEENAGVFLWATEEGVALEAPTTEAKPRCCLNRQYLLDALAHTSTGRGRGVIPPLAHFGGPLDPVVFMAEDGRQVVVMPIRM